MLLASLLAFTASLILPLVVASSPLVSVVSTDRNVLRALEEPHTGFCGDVPPFNRGIYGVSDVPMGLVPAPGAAKCGTNNQSISGPDGVDAGYEAYNLRRWNTTSYSARVTTYALVTTSGAGTPVLLNLASSTQTSSSTSTGEPTATKPKMGITALGTNDAAAVIIEASGLTLIGVAVIFTWYL